MRADAIAAVHQRFGGRIVNLTARLMRSHHFQLKAIAKTKGMRTSDLYVLLIEDFINSDFDGLEYLYAVTDEAVAVSIPAPQDLIDLVREKARAKGVGANELIFSAVATRLRTELMAVA